MNKNQPLPEMVTAPSINRAWTQTSQGLELGPQSSGAGFEVQRMRKGIARERERERRQVSREAAVCKDVASLGI